MIVVLSAHKKKFSLFRMTYTNALIYRNLSIVQLCK